MKQIDNLIGSTDLFDLRYAATRYLVHRSTGKLVRYPVDLLSPLRGATES